MWDLKGHLEKARRFYKLFLLCGLLLLVQLVCCGCEAGVKMLQYHCCVCLSGSLVIQRSNIYFIQGVEQASLEFKCHSSWMLLVLKEDYSCNIDQNAVYSEESFVFGLALNPSFLK